MSKHIYSSSNDFIIATTLKPVDICAKRGQECEHFENVDWIAFYQQDYGQTNFTKVYLSRKEILDLSEKIKEIEANKQILVFEDMPF